MRIFFEFNRVYLVICLSSPLLFACLVIIYYTWNWLSAAELKLSVYWSQGHLNTLDDIRWYHTLSVLILAISMSFVLCVYSVYFQISITTQNMCNKQNVRSYKYISHDVENMPVTDSSMTVFSYINSNIQSKCFHCSYCKPLYFSYLPAYVVCPILYQT